MIGYFPGFSLRGKQLSLVLIVLVCVFIFIWTWEKNPILTSLLPSQTNFLQLSTGAPEVAKSSLHVKSPEINASKHDPLDEAVKKKISEGKHLRQEVLSVDAIAPVSFENTGYTILREESKSSDNGVCNYGNGKWVVDHNRPLYSGFDCKQWLSDMWACRLTQRTDFSYEELRWQPKNCKMEGFSGSKFLKRLQHKTLAFVGDSLGRQQFQSLMCILTGGELRLDVLDVGKEYGLVKARGAKRPDGWAYHFPSTNSTILYYWSASLCELQPLNITDPNTYYAMHLDRPPYFLKRFLHKFSILILNTGHHWNRYKLAVNRWVVHVGGVPNTKKKIAEMGGAKNLTIHSIVKWVDSQIPNYPGLKAFYRSISPRHFSNGDWNTGGSCDNTSPTSIGREIFQEESSDSSAAGAVRGTMIKLLDVTGLTQLREEGHVSRYSKKGISGVQDCLHWCLPGVPDTWNEILFAQI